MTIELIGWFRELPHGDPRSDLSLRDLQGCVEGLDRERIARYLDDGAVVAETMGTQCRDMLAPDKPVIGPLQTKTDGILVWPSDLAYYVRNHGVCIPRAAVDRMHAHGFKTPLVTEANLDRVANELLGD